jgi:hypothetical protein
MTRSVGAGELWGSWASSVIAGSLRSGARCGGAWSLSCAGLNVSSTSAQGSSVEDLRLPALAAVDGSLGTIESHTQRLGCRTPRQPGSA